MRAETRQELHGAQSTDKPPNHTYLFYKQVFTYVCTFNDAISKTATFPFVKKKKPKQSRNPKESPQSDSNYGTGYFSVEKIITLKPSFSAVRDCFHKAVVFPMRVPQVEDQQCGQDPAKDSLSTISALYIVRQ